MKNSATAGKTEMVIYLHKFIINYLMNHIIPFDMLIRAIRHCSTFQAYIEERESLRMTLLLNKYPSELVSEQFQQVLLTFIIDQPCTLKNYDLLRERIINSSAKEKCRLINVK